jgi:predicted kinase
MRKWMRERLQRRKKNTAAQTDSPSAPPLQPAYFDANDESGPPSQAQPRETEVEEQPAELPEDQPAAEASGGRSERAPENPAVESQPPTHRPAASSVNRNRRRRGGRGRGGRGREQAVAQAFAPAAAKGSRSSLREPGVDDETPDASEAQAEAGPDAAAAEAPEVPAVPAAPPRPPKGVVVLAIGLPGSGKSSWFKRHKLTPLSSDVVRSLLFDDVREQRYQDLVFSNLRSMLKARLIAKRPTNYVDATNLTPHERQHWIKLAKDYNYEVHAVFFDVPLEVCIERHQRRDRVVPEDVMRRMAAKLKPPTFEEGFAKITVVRVKKKQPEAEQPGGET